MKRFLFGVIFFTLFLLINLHSDLGTPTPAKRKTGQPVATTPRNSQIDEGGQAINIPKGWHLKWSDEFNGGETDKRFWTLQTGEKSWGNNELQYYTDRTANCYVADGKLFIVGLKENLGKSQYTSARITTKGKVDFLYGRIDIRAKLPEGKGLFPAFWLLPVEDNYGNRRKNGEIDIMEMLGDEPRVIYAVAHYAKGNKYKSSSKFYGWNKDFSKGFHVFSLEWSPKELRWLVDNEEYYSLDLRENFPGDYKPFSKRFYLILNLAIGGNWPGRPSKDTVFPAQMEIDYVRYFVVPSKP